MSACDWPTCNAERTNSVVLDEGVGGRRRSFALCNKHALIVAIWGAASLELGGHVDVVAVR